MATDDTCVLGSPAMLQRAASCSPVEMISMIHSLPKEWFSAGPSTVRGLCRLARAVRDQSQAELFKAVCQRSVGLLEQASVPDHLFLANCVGKSGNAAAVDILFEQWRKAIRSPEFLTTIGATVAASALMHGNAGAWEGVAAQDPPQANRSDRLRLACSRARSSVQFEWALTHAAFVPWQELLHTAWEVLSRAWEGPGCRHVVESPELAVSVASRLCSLVPWREPGVVEGAEALFNHTLSPFRGLTEAEYRTHPLIRLRGLVAFQELAEYLEGQGVTLHVGSARLDECRHRQQVRLA